MQGANWGDVPAWVASAAAVIFSVTAFVISLRSLKWQRIAASAAVKSANADEQSLVIAQLQVEQQARASENPPKVSWRLESPRKDVYILRNAGSELATGVTIDEAQVTAMAAEVPKGVAIRAGGSHEFIMAATMGHPMPNEVWLTWDGAREQLALPVPR